MNIINNKKKQTSNGVNKIDLQLRKIKKEGRLGLMTHIVVGYPSLPRSLELVRMMIAEGVDFLELQIPFSDPMADGPTLMAANEMALSAGATVKKAMAAMRQLSKLNTPLLFMTYFNIVLQYGTQKFCRDAAKAGCSGLIVPDIPLEEEENEHFIAAAEKNNLHAIRLLSPASTGQRLKLNSRVAKGFVYFTSRKGVTGSRRALDSDLTHHLGRIKKYFSIPVAVGFGLSVPEHVQALKGKAEIAVVGSAITDTYNRASSGQKAQSVRRLVKKLVRACY